MKKKIINTPFGKAEVIMEENLLTGKVDILMSKKRYKKLINRKYGNHKQKKG